MLWGVFQGTLEVAMNTQGVAVESAQRRPVMPTFHGSWSLGALAGAGIGTVAVALGVPLTSQLLVLGVMSLAGAHRLDQPVAIRRSDSTLLRTLLPPTRPAGSVGGRRQPC